MSRLVHARRRIRTTLQWLRESRSLRTWLFYLPGPGPWLMSWLRKRWVLFRNPKGRIEFRGPVYLGPGFSLDMPRGGTFIVGPGVEFRRGFRAELSDAGSRVTIGGGTKFTYDVVIQCGTSIDIGRHCTFAQSALIVDGNHRYRALDRSLVDQGYDFRPLTISDHASVMAKCTVIADLGERAFVGANSAVTRPIPPFCVAAGSPARVLDYFGPVGQEPEGLLRSAEAVSGS